MDEKTIVPALLSVLSIIIGFASLKDSILNGLILIAIGVVIILFNPNLSKKFVPPFKFLTNFFLKKIFKRDGQQIDQSSNQESGRDSLSMQAGRDIKQTIYMSSKPSRNFQKKK